MRLAFFLVSTPVKVGVFFYELLGSAPRMIE